MSTSAHTVQQNKEEKPQLNIELKPKMEESHQIDYSRSRSRSRSRSYARDSSTKLANEAKEEKELRKRPNPNSRWDSCSPQTNPIRMQNMSKKNIENEKDNIQITRNPENESKKAEYDCNTDQHSNISASNTNLPIANHNLPETVLGEVIQQSSETNADLIENENENEKDKNACATISNVSNIQYNIDPGTLRKFCQPYSMKELIDLLLSQSRKNSEFHNTLVHTMRHEPKWCKLFVHGLPWSTTEQTLFQHFRPFGNITECCILKDRAGQSKGYGFINYSTADEALYAINAGPRFIDGRTVRTDLAWKGRKKRQQMQKI